MSCTVEILSVMEPVDVAVIDEIQMIGDSQRGWAWTRAVMGVPVRHGSLLCALPLSSLPRSLSTASRTLTGSSRLRARTHSLTHSLRPHAHKVGLTRASLSSRHRGRWGDWFITHVSTLRSPHVTHQATEIHLCGNASAIEAVKRIMEQTGDELEVRRRRRCVPTRCPCRRP
jgi:hypothetical protein